MKCLYFGGKSCFLLTFDIFCVACNLFFEDSSFDDIPENLWVPIRLKLEPEWCICASEVTNGAHIKLTKCSEKGNDPLQLWYYDGFRIHLKANPNLVMEFDQNPTNGSIPSVNVL